MSPKRGNKNFYKGYGSRRMGRHTSKGEFLNMTNPILSYPLSLSNLKSQTHFSYTLNVFH
jgi:hypothetical protein